MREACPFCNTSLELERFERIKQIAGIRRENPVVYNGRYIRVVPDFYPVSPLNGEDGYHLLLVTERHVVSMADLSEDEYREKEQLAERIMGRLGGGVRFEHGGRGSNGHTSMKSIHHAHEHLVGLRKREVEEVQVVVEREMLSMGFLKREGDVKGVLGERQEDDPYLYVALGGRKFVFCPGNGSRDVPSQFMKRVIMARGKGFINWKEMGLDEEVLMAMRARTTFEKFAGNGDGCIMENR